MTNTTATDPFAAIAEDPRYLGWGYLCRRDNLSTADRGVADGVVFGAVDALGWSAEDLFAWANSRTGRWFGDLAEDLASAGADALRDQAIAWRLFELPA